MEELDRIIRRHQNLSKATSAFFYALSVAFALNFFWEPGGIYASGITGAAQLVSTVTSHSPIHLSTPLMITVLNAPLFILAWRKIGHHFTLFTILSVVLSSLFLKMIAVNKLTPDPIICAIFGAIFNGIGTGLALRNGISTGGLDIIGITLRKKTGKSVGTINIAFNVLILIAAGFIYSWPHALYSALGIFINGRVIDMIYTKDRRLQVMIVTGKPKAVITQIQNEMPRGITIVHDAEGAYKRQEKTILFTVISQFEIYDLENAMKLADANAFVSITSAVKIIGRFIEPKQ
ncbi:integral membrane protein [Agrilactobacillus composti DSM 18527 = JCM 14202]|nr:YitT family protein [Agrilactobacillus composti]GAF40801.1 integral membrane protein [Agrilactobacillus composti DSM 18527 = JCM 14202]